MWKTYVSPLAEYCEAPETVIVSTPTLSVVTTVNTAVCDWSLVNKLTVALSTLNELTVGTSVSLLLTVAWISSLVELPPLSVAVTVIVSSVSP